MLGVHLAGVCSSGRPLDRAAPLLWATREPRGGSTALQPLHRGPPAAGCAVSAGSKLFNILYDKGLSAPFYPKHSNASHCSARQTAPLASHDAVIGEALRKPTLMAVKLLQHSMYPHSSCEWCHPPGNFGPAAGSIRALTKLALGRPIMRVYSGMTVTVAAENKASGPRNALDVWHPPAKCLIVCQFSHNGTCLHC